MGLKCTGEHIAIAMVAASMALGHPGGMAVPKSPGPAWRAISQPSVYLEFSKRLELLAQKPQMLELGQLPAQLSWETEAQLPSSHSRQEGGGAGSPACVAHRLAASERWWGSLDGAHPPFRGRQAAGRAGAVGAQGWTGRESGGFVVACKGLQESPGRRRAAASRARGSHGGGRPLLATQCSPHGHATPAMTALEASGCLWIGWLE